MRRYPLLDLHSAWQDAHRTLQEIQTLAEELYHEAERTWSDMAIVQQKVIGAIQVLGELPPGIMDGIARDQADLEDEEARAPENTQGY